ncbi:MAG: flavin reductase family protein [Dehalococcoidales bacterium]
MKINPADVDGRGTHELIMSAVVPRPIAFISTIGEDGTLNLAPFSAYTSICLKPALLCFSISRRRNGQEKDTLLNIKSSEDFVINVVDEDLAEAMNQTSADYPSEVDEFKQVGLTPAKSDIVKAPRVAESPVSMECKLHQILEFGEPPGGARVVIGEVVLIHVRDELWTGSFIDPEKLKAVSRIGGMDGYCRSTDIFKMSRPPQ